jgi:hypothetical protein
MKPGILIRAVVCRRTESRRQAVVRGASPTTWGFPMSRVAGRRVQGGFACLKLRAWSPSDDLFQQTGRQAPPDERRGLCPQ